MITVVEGRPGQGKSAYLVHRILGFLQRGIDVYTNVELTLPSRKKYLKHYHYIESLDDCLELRTGKIVLDEVQVYLNSRNWDKLDQRFQLLLQQHRKRGLDIIGACQSVKRADVVFRELVQYFYRVHKVFSFRITKNLGFGLFLLREYDPDSIESASRQYDQVGWLRPVFLDPFTLRVFDTTQEMGFRSPLGRREIHEYVFVEKKGVDKRLLSRKVVDV